MQVDLSAVADSRLRHHGRPNALLGVEIPEDIAIPFEFVEDGKTYREFLVPAELVNRYGPPSLIEVDCPTLD